MMTGDLFPKRIPNVIRGRDEPPAGAEWFEKRLPADGGVMYEVARSREPDARRAVQAAREAQPVWAELTPVRRGEILMQFAQGLRARREELSRVVALETGKSMKAALGETEGAASLGTFFAGEGQRLFGRTLPSGTPNKHTMTIRQPLGVAALIIAANTPVPNAAWKVFPALICGNAAVLKAAEDTPASAWLFAQIAHEAGLPDGVLNVIQGYGQEVGAPLIADPGVDVISFTGSTAVGRSIAAAAGERLARVSLELGGKNPLVVCDDADLENAVKWTLLSAFSNAGQRCASGSRILVFDAVYDRFRRMVVEATTRLKVGTGDDADLGPVINERQLNNMLSAIQRAKAGGAIVLTGGERLEGGEYRRGYFLSPTLIENVTPDDEISTRELFGPVACLYRVRDFAEALETANRSPYGLTAAIHTRSIHRAVQFSQKAQAGVVVVNAGTYGSEPHMPFGGFKQSGNGTREPGTEALDVYSELKAINFVVDPSAV